ncbi:hypothetical protein GW755_02015 [bacterium]|nr:hypothetical protein [bacterium]
MTTDEASLNLKTERLPEILYHGSPASDIAALEPRKRYTPGKDKISAPPRVYASPNPAFSAAHSFAWGSNEGFRLSVDSAGKVLFTVPIKFKQRLEQPVFIYKFPSEGFVHTDEEKTGQTYHTEGTVKPTEIEAFENVQKAIEHLGGVVEYFEDLNQE